MKIKIISVIFLKSLFWMKNCDLSNVFKSDSDWIKSLLESSSVGQEFQRVWVMTWNMILQWSRVDRAPKKDSLEIFVTALTRSQFFDASESNLMESINQLEWFRAWCAFWHWSIQSLFTWIFIQKSEIEIFAHQRN